MWVRLKRNDRAFPQETWVSVLTDQCVQRPPKSTLFSFVCSLGLISGTTKTPWPDSTMSNDDLRFPVVGICLSCVPSTLLVRVQNPGHRLCFIFINLIAWYIYWIYIYDTLYFNTLKINWFEISKADSLADLVLHFGNFQVLECLKRFA